MDTVLLPEAEEELAAIQAPRERVALVNALAKLEALGSALGYPHSSRVRGSGDLRELRPRAGRSPWRAFYRRVGPRLIVAAIGPEAAVDARGFRAAVVRAEERLSRVQREEGEAG